MIASVFYRNRFLGKTFWFTAIGIYQYDGPDTSFIEDGLARIEERINALTP